MFFAPAVISKGFLDFDFEHFSFLDSLKVMLYGMALIFFVTAILIVFVLILNNYSKKKKEKEEKAKKTEIENESY